MDIGDAKEYDLLQPFDPRPLANSPALNLAPDFEDDVKTSKERDNRMVSGVAGLLLPQRRSGRRGTSGLSHGEIRKVGISGAIDAN